MDFFPHSDFPEVCGRVSDIAGIPLERAEPMNECSGEVYGGQRIRNINCPSYMIRNWWKIAWWMQPSIA